MKQDRTRGVTAIFDDIERLLLVIVSRIAPWAAPLAPAYLVAQAMATYFHSPPWVQVATALTIEAVGLASTHTALVLYSYNQTRGKSAPRAPFELALGTSFVYFAAGIILTTLLALRPDWVVWAPMTFFVLAGDAYIVLALMAGHSSRLARLETAKIERREARSRAKAEREAEAASKGTGSKQSGTSRQCVLDALAELQAAGEDVTVRSVAARAGVAVGTAQRYLKEVR